MNFKTSDIIIGLLMIGTSIGSGFFQLVIKHNVQVFMLVPGLMTLASFAVKNKFASSVSFYLLLGVMTYETIFSVSVFILNKLNSTDGWSVDKLEVRHRIMQVNWIWAVLSGLLLTIVLLVFYNKKVQRNKILEIAYSLLYIVVTAFVYAYREIW